MISPEARSTCGRHRSLDLLPWLRRGDQRLRRDRRRPRLVIDPFVTVCCRAGLTQWLVSVRRLWSRSEERRAGEGPVHRRCLVTPVRLCVGGAMWRALVADEKPQGTPGKDLLAGAAVWLRAWPRSRLRSRAHRDRPALHMPRLADMFSISLRVRRCSGSSSDRSLAPVRRRGARASRRAVHRRLRGRAG